MSHRQIIAKSITPSKARAGAKLLARAPRGSGVTTALLVVILLLAACAPPAQGPPTPPPQRVVLVMPATPAPTPSITPMLAASDEVVLESEARFFAMYDAGGEGLARSSGWTDGVVHFRSAGRFVWIGPGPSTGGSAEPNDRPYGDTFFDHYGVNPFIDAEDDHLSTFAADVDTGSYSIMRSYLHDGHLPPDESVRVEEYINYFDQGYEPPAADNAAFAIHLDGAPAPYGGERYHLVRVGLQGYKVPAEERDDVILTFVIDVSGSMDYENRLGLVKRALRLLVEELRPTDRIAIAVYGTNGRILLTHTPVEQADTVLNAIDALQPEGATNAAEGLTMGYLMAAAAFDPEATNRVILCSDGVANVGNTSAGSIRGQISTYAKEGIYLTTVGFGMANYNDVLMEQLADDGDGFYAYVDTIDEAERLFVHDLTSSLQVIARDVKIQVEFDPEVVSRYRLIGYENRDVADEDFRNDEVDAGEIGPGHSVTALYELKFHRGASDLKTAMTVHVRYENPDSGEVVEISRSIARVHLEETFEEALARFQLTAVVAEYAEVLRESYWAKESSLEDVLADARRVEELLPHDEDVAEFVELVGKAAGLAE